MKYFITGLLIIGAAFQSVAQTNFAVTAGYNHNTARILTNNVKQSTGYKPGFNLGARLKTSFEPPLHFVAAISYNNRGYTFEPSTFGDTSKIETSIHYIDIAPMLNYDFNVGNNNKISLTAGPVLGIAFSGKQKITEDGVTKSSDMKFSMSGNYGYFNVGIHSGISYQFNKMFVEAAYHLGFSSISNEEELDKTNIKNRGFSLTLGYWLK
ncbi:MAG: PorT family protein [Chitinophagaceae bacterium]|nr:MAG: PorT family protein [Chitinophagaceae bacterium]